MKLSCKKNLTDEETYRLSRKRRVTENVFEIKLVRSNLKKLKANKKTWGLLTTKILNRGDFRPGANTFLSIT